MNIIPMIALAIKKDKQVTCVAFSQAISYRYVYKSPFPLPITDTALSGTISERGAKA